MSAPRLHLRPGNTIVLEGLDKTGKSTQIARLQGVISPASASFAHMPSGLTDFSRTVYSILEDGKRRPRSGLAQQLAHLACHAENMPALTSVLTSKALVLDRCWWSTVVYGWYGGPLSDGDMPRQTFDELIAAVWAPVAPALVFVFLSPHEEDRNNNPAIAAGYRALLDQHPDHAIAVPSGSADEIEQFLLSELRERELVTEVEHPR